MYLGRSRLSVACFFPYKKYYHYSFFFNFAGNKHIILSDMSYYTNCYTQENTDTIINSVVQEYEIEFGKPDQVIRCYYDTEEDNFVKLINQARIYLKAMKLIFVTEKQILIIPFEKIKKYAVCKSCCSFGTSFEEPNLGLEFFFDDDENPFISINFDLFEEQIYTVTASIDGIIKRNSDNSEESQAEVIVKPFDIRLAGEKLGISPQNPLDKYKGKAASSRSSCLIILTVIISLISMLCFVVSCI